MGIGLRTACLVVLATIFCYGASCQVMENPDGSTSIGANIQEEVTGAGAAGMITVPPEKPIDPPEDNTPVAAGAWALSLIAANAAKSIPWGKILMSVF